MSAVAPSATALPAAEPGLVGRYCLMLRQMAARGRDLAWSLQAAVRDCLHRPARAARMLARICRIMRGLRLAAALEAMIARDGLDGFVARAPRDATPRQPVAAPRLLPPRSTAAVTPEQELKRFIRGRSLDDILVRLCRMLGLARLDATDEAEAENDAGWRSAPPPAPPSHSNPRDFWHYRPRPG